MTENEIAIEESKKTTSRTTRFAEWLMAREERRQEKESNLEGLMKLNFLVSTATLIAVAGATSLNYLMIAWSWL